MRIPMLVKNRGPKKAIRPSMGAAVNVKYAIPPWQMTRVATSMTRKNAASTRMETKTGMPK